jgi:SAM-dependent methyltransferase
MPISPNFLERLVLLRLNKGPAPMLDLFGAASFESVSLALEMDLFEALAESESPLSAEMLANQVDAHPDGINILCDFLVAEGYLTTTREAYQLTGMTEKWLLTDSVTDMGPWFTFWNELVFPFWERELETAIREGEPSQSIYEWFDEEPDRWEVAQDGFRATASLLVEDIADAVTVPDSATRLIDIGGGHGLYAIELCRRHPHLMATVFDVPGAIAAISNDIPADIAERVGTHTGDYFTDNLEGNYDIALLFNVIHAHEPAENIALFERVADALAPSGRIVVLDQWAGSGRTPVSRAGLQFVALTYLTTLGANAYHPKEVASWLSEAGFGDIHRQSVGPLSGLAIIEASKQ